MPPIHCGCLALAAMVLAGCSQQPPTSLASPQPYCLRAGAVQAYDCTAPPIALEQLRDPLEPLESFSDTELMSLLADVRRWLARRKLELLGQPVPPELQQPIPLTPSAPVAVTHTAPLWPNVMDAVSRPSLQRNNQPDLH